MRSARSVAPVECRISWCAVVDDSCPWLVYDPIAEMPGLEAQVEAIHGCIIEVEDRIELQTG
jgi:hypothetical protein